jgi:hypothetical protein
MSDPEVSPETAADLSIEDELTQAFGAETPADAESPPASAAQTASSAAPVGDSQSQAATTAVAPQHWSEADKSLFSKAPPEIQQRWIAREAELQRGYDAKFQEVAGFRREREQYDQLLSPFKRDLELRGLSPVQFMSSLIGGHKYLQESPREALLWLAQTYGVDPKTLVQPQEGVDPKYAQLEQRLNQVTGQFEGYTQAQQAAAHAEKLNRVTSFADEKGADGQPAHPFFDEVAGDILALMKATPGLALETAYTKAVRMNDAVFEKVQLSRTQATQAAQDAAKKAAVDKARRAAAPNGTGTANGATRPKSLEQDLRDGFANWAPD